MTFAASPRARSNYLSLGQSLARSAARQRPRVAY
jgi:hypothetical protein